MADFLGSIGETLRTAKLRKALLRVFVPAALIAVMFGAWHASLPSFGPATYHYDALRPTTTPLPLSVGSISRKLFVRTTIVARPIHPTLFTIVPDDCLKRLVVNGDVIGIPPSICYNGGGGRISLAGHLKSGVNTVEMEIDDWGGKGGVRIAVSLFDPLLQGIGGLALLMVLGGLASLCALTEQRRAGYAVLAIMALAVVVRLPLLVAPGYPADVSLFVGWARSASELGVGQSYLRQVGSMSIPNYPALSIEMLWATARVYRFLIDPSLDPLIPDFATFLKAPAVLADALTAGVLFHVVRRMRGQSVRAGALAALAYALNPAVFYESGVWGQYDGVFSGLALAALAAASGGSFALAGAFAAFALLAKLQAFLILPTLGLLCLAERRVLRTIAGGLAGTALVIAPIASGPTLKVLRDVYLHSVGYYPLISMEAFNMWTVLYGRKDQFKTDREPLFGLASPRDIGLLIFGGLVVTLCVIVWRRLQRAARGPRTSPIVFVAPALTAYAFFLFNTQMHERYLFPMMAFGVPLLFVSRLGRRAYLASAVLFFLNLLGSDPFTKADRALFHDLPNVAALIGGCHLLAFAAAFRAMRRMKADA